MEKAPRSQQKKAVKVADSDGGSFDANAFLFPASKTLPEFGISDGKTRMGQPMLLPYKLKLPKTKPLGLVVVRLSIWIER